METSSIKSDLKELKNELALSQFRQDVANGLMLINNKEDVKVSDIWVKVAHPEWVPKKTISDIETYFWNRFGGIHFERLCEEIVRGCYDEWIGDCYLQPRNLTEESCLETYLEVVLDVCKRLIQYHLHNDDAELFEKFGCESLCSEVYVDHKDFVKAYKKLYVTR